MASHLQWSDLLEEEAYLVQMVFDTPQDVGALEQTTNTLEVFRADLQSCTSKIADLERDIEDSRSKESPSSGSSSTSRFFHRVTESISSIHLHDKGRGHDANSERLLEATTRKRTLRMEIKNLESKALILRRRMRHHEELKRRLKALYDRIFNNSNISSPEEEEAETEVRRAQQTLHQIQKTIDRHRTLTALLGYGDFALSNAGPHLSAASNEGKGVNPAALQAEVIAAKTYALQAYIVVNQAKGLDPALFEEEKGSDVFRADWMSSVFRTLPVGNSDAKLYLFQEATQNPSLQALQSHRTALLSLLNLTRKKGQEHETNLRRAANWHADAYCRKQALRRRVLLEYAGVEEDRAQGNAEGSRDGLGRIRDVTAGLDKLVSVADLSRLAVPQNEQGEDKKRTSTEWGRRSSNRDRSPGTSPGIASPLMRPSGDLSRSQPTEVLQPLAQGVQTLQPSPDGRPEDMRAQAVYGSSLFSPVQSPPGGGPGVAKAYEARRSPQPTSGPQPQARAPSTLKQMPVSSRDPPAQPLPPSSSRRYSNPEKFTNPEQPLPEMPLSRSVTHATKPSNRPVGILKSPTVAPQPPPSDPSDSWGVKIASAGPSRSRPRLKNMITKLRGGEEVKSPDSHSGAMPDQRPPPPPVHESPRSSNWKLRFSETVVVIPRPAVDSDPYEDENDDYMPPSPKRGSVMWRTDDLGEEDESEEGGDNRSTKHSRRGLAQIDTAMPRQPEATHVAVTDSSAASDGRGLHSRVTALYPSGSDPGSTFTGPSTPEWHDRTAISQNSFLNQSDVLAKQGLRQVPLGLSGGVTGDRRREPVTAPGAYPEQPRVPRLLSEAGRMPLDDIRVESRRTLASPEDARGRFMSPSDPTLASSQFASRQSASIVPHMTRGGAETRSDHDLVQTIFPSPSSTVSERDLLFTK